MLKIIRITLGSIIAFINWATRGPKLKRTSAEQMKIEKELKSLSIFQFQLCPFCIKTRRVLHQLNLPIELFDAKNDELSRKDLLEQGGKIKVPCLRITKGEQHEWLYDSTKIIDYLNTRFAKI